MAAAADGAMELVAVAAANRGGALREIPNWRVRAPGAHSRPIVHAAVDAVKIRIFFSRGTFFS